MDKASIRDKYDYSFPNNLIALAPASPRDAAKLLAYNRSDGAVCFDTFLHLERYLPKGAVLVFNETKVIPARLSLKKDTGGAVRILYISRNKKTISVLADRKLTSGSTLFLTRTIFFVVKERRGNEYVIIPSFPLQRLDALLMKYGEMPIPPYMKQTALKERTLREQYQTVFGKKPGAIAAPTASLHFSKRLLVKLKKSGFEQRFITLHVGLGTFALLTDTQISRRQLHKEQYDISKETADALNHFKKEGRPIIAVGTTVVRTLESATDTNGMLKKLTDSTDLFIREGYRFRFIDGMITNFHVPKSSLIMLVSAFAGREEVLQLYRLAIQKKFRLFSFGDGMLVV